MIERINHYIFFGMEIYEYYVKQSTALVIYAVK